MQNKTTGLTINKAQKMVADFVKRRDWDKQSLPVDITFMTEELGEVAKEALILEVERKEKKSKKKGIESLGEELADLFYWILKVSARFNINLERVFLKKMKKNEERCFPKREK